MEAEAKAEAVEAAGKSAAYALLSVMLLVTTAPSHSAVQSAMLSATPSPSHSVTQSFKLPASKQRIHLDNQLFLFHTHWHTHTDLHNCSIKNARFRIYQLDYHGPTDGPTDGQSLL